MRNRAHVAGQKTPMKAASIAAVIDPDDAHRFPPTHPANRGLAIVVYFLLTVGATLNNTRPLSFGLTALLLAIGTHRSPVLWPPRQHRRSLPCPACTPLPTMATGASPPPPLSFHNHNVVARRHLDELCYLDRLRHRSAQVSLHALARQRPHLAACARHVQQACSSVARHHMGRHHAVFVHSSSTAVFGALEPGTLIKRNRTDGVRSSPTPYKQPAQLPGHAGFGIASRVLLTLACAFALRPLFFLCTVLPSAMPGCYAARFPTPPPTHWRDFVAVGFASVRGQGGCNDLVFSGHAVLWTVVPLAYGRYAGRRDLSAVLWAACIHACAKVRCPGSLLVSVDSKLVFLRT